MPYSFVFWNTYRLGAGSSDNKLMIMEAVLAQIFDGSNAEFAALCEVTGDVNLGSAQVGKNLYQRTRRHGQLAYSAFDSDLNNLELEAADVDDFVDVFGGLPYKKGGGKFSKQSKRPVAYLGEYANVHVYIYHANATKKSSFLVAWVAEWLRQNHGAKFVLAGDLNCEPVEFNTAMDLCTKDHNHKNHFATPSGGQTHNAKSGLTKTYDWAVTGAGLGATVMPFDFSKVIAEMKFKDDPKSDHLPILVSW